MFLQHPATFTVDCLVNHAPRARRKAPALLFYCAQCFTLAICLFALVSANLDFIRSNIRILVLS